MSLSPLLIGTKQQADIKRLIDRASQQVVPHDIMKKMAEGQIPVDRMRNLPLTIAIPVGYDATYTHEEHKPGVVCRHLSVSVERRHRVPNLDAMQVVMNEFGFINKIDFLLRVGAVWTEIAGTRTAVNVVEPLSGDLRNLNPG